jgi:hypothetical protein
MADFGTEVLGVLGAVAPALATAVGGPLAGAAVRAIGSALGLPDGTTASAVSAAVLGATPDQLLALKKADNDFAQQMKQLDVDFAKLSSEDAASARAREIAVHDHTPSLLAFALTAGFFGLLGLMAFHALPTENMTAVNVMLGALGTAWMAAMNYFFGSTYGSKTKDAMLFQSVPASSLPPLAAAPAGRSPSPAASNQG